MTGSTWALERDQILAIPIDELALAVLRDFDVEGGWNAYSWMISAHNRFSGAGEVLRPLAEAWAWLLAHGLVARDFSQTAAEAVFITRAGRRALNEGMGEAKAVERLQLELHPRLESEVRHTYLVGDYDTAVFKAFKLVEVRVRNLISAPAGLIGVALMQEAFRENGPLWADTIDKAEGVARMNLFKGSIGVSEESCKPSRSPV